MEAKLTEERIQNREVYKGCVFRVTEDTVKLPDGTLARRDVVRHNGAVCVLPVTDDGCILAVKQYRHGCDRVTLEIPAGKLDTPDEDPLEAAKRELSEETGAVAARMTYLGEYYGSPAILSEKIHMYVAEGLTFGKTHPDSDEFLSVESVPLSHFVKKILGGEICDGKTQVAVLRYAVASLPFEGNPD